MGKKNNQQEEARVAPKAFIFGGCGQYPLSSRTVGGKPKVADPTCFSNEVHCVDTSITSDEGSERFHLVDTANPPAPRVHHAAATDGVHLLIHGGVGEDGEILGDVHALNVAIGETLGVEVGAPPTTPWLPLVSQGPPLFQHAMCCVPTKTTLICVGGFLAKAPIPVDSPRYKQHQKDAVFGTQDSIPNDAVYTLPLAPPSADEVHTWERKHHRKFEPEWSVFEALNSPFAPRLGQIQKVPLPDCISQLDSHVFVGIGPSTMFDVKLASTSHFPELHVLSLESFIWTHVNLELVPRPVPASKRRLKDDSGAFALAPTVFPTAMTIDPVHKGIHIVAVSVPERRTDKKHPSRHHHQHSEFEEEFPEDEFDDPDEEENELDFEHAEYLYYKEQFAPILQNLKDQQCEEEHDRSQRYNHGPGAGEENQEEEVHVSRVLEVPLELPIAIEGLPAARRWMCNFVMSGHFFVSGGEELALDHFNRFKSKVERQEEQQRLDEENGVFNSAAGGQVDSEALLMLLSTAADPSHEVPTAPGGEGDAQVGSDNLSVNSSFSDLEPHTNQRHQGQDDGLIPPPQSLVCDLEALITENDDERRFYYNDAYSCVLPGSSDSQGQHGQQQIGERPRAQTSLGFGTGSMKFASGPGIKRNHTLNKTLQHSSPANDSTKLITFKPLFDPSQGAESARYVDHYASRKTGKSKRSEVPVPVDSPTYPVPKEVANSSKLNKSGPRAQYVPPHQRPNHQFKTAEPDWDLYYGMPPKDQLQKKRNASQMAVEKMTQGEVVMHRRRVLSALLEDKLMVSKLRSEGESFETMKLLKQQHDEKIKSDSKLTTDQRRESRRVEGRTGSAYSSVTGSGSSVGGAKAKKRNQTLSAGVKLSGAKRAALVRYEKLLDETIQEHLREINEYSSQLRGDVEPEVTAILLEAAVRAAGLPPSKTGTTANDKKKAMAMQDKKAQQRRLRNMSLLTSSDATTGSRPPSRQQPGPRPGKDGAPPTAPAAGTRPLSGASSRPMSAGSARSDTSSVPRSEPGKSSKRRALEAALAMNHEESVLMIQRGQRRQCAREEVAKRRRQREAAKGVVGKEETGFESEKDNLEPALDP